MKGRIGIILCVALLFVCLNACSNSKNEYTNSSETDEASNDAHIVITDTEDTQEVQTDKKIIYEGEYASDELNTLSISERGGVYDVNISIYRLASIDGVGTVENEEMTFVGMDPNGNPIGAKLVWKTDNDVVLTFTVSTWEYLSGDTVFEFQRRIGEQTHSVNMIRINTEDTYGELYISETSESFIPELSSTGTMLSSDFSAVRRRLGYDLMGPDANWSNYAEELLSLHNLDFTDCFINVSSNELYGFENGEIVFYGRYGTTSYALVKDFLPDEALMREPAVYSVNSGKLEAFVFKLQNGYEAVLGVPVMSTEWYDLPSYSVVLVKDLKYLSFIDDVFYAPQFELSEEAMVVDDYLNNPVQSGFAEDMGYLTKIAESDEYIYWHWMAGGGYGVIKQSAVEPYDIITEGWSSDAADDLLVFAEYRANANSCFRYSSLNYIGTENVVYHGDTVIGEHWQLIWEDGTCSDYVAVCSIVNDTWGGGEITTTAFFEDGVPWVYYYDGGFVYFG